MFRSFSWLGALSIIVLFLFTELIPIIFGAGEQAKWDFSFLYITIKFIILPLLCFIHIGINTARYYKSQRNHLTLIQFSSIFISVGYLVLLYLYPLPLIG